MKIRNLFQNIREYENLHIALWLIKDTCWVTSFKTGGMLMIIPTLAVALHLVWRTRKNLSDLFHNIAVCLWITANATWMTGEFFYFDGLRPYAMIFFAAGILVISGYYVYHFSRGNGEPAVKENRNINLSPEETYFI